MKKFYIVFLLCLTFSSSIYSQLPNGSLAPDFNLRDMNGNFHHLYDVLDSGKIVILDMFFTGCHPCWDYFQGGALKKALAKWGTAGTNQIRIFMIETLGAPDSSIRGHGPDTQGDWTLNNPIPIIYTHSPNNYDFYTLYGAIYAPMIYMICKNKRTILMQEPDTASIHSFMNSCPLQPSDSVRLSLYSIDSLSKLICEPEPLAFITTQNIGIDSIKSIHLKCKFDNNIYDSIKWSGNIPTYKNLCLSVPSLPSYNEGSHLLQIVTFSINGKFNNIPKDTANFRFTYSTSSQPLPFSENFSNTSFPYNKWTIDNPYPSNPTFSLEQLGYSNAIKIPFYNISAYTRSSLILPALNFSGITPQLQFEAAASADSLGDDRILFYGSSDCGENWDFANNFFTHNLKTAPAQSSPYTPMQSQWKTFSVTFDSLKNKDNAIIKILSESMHNNNIYLRNFNIIDATGIKEFSKNYTKVYPNPTSSTITIESNDITNIELYNIQGQKVFIGTIPTPKYIIDINNFPKGIYLLKLYGKNGVGVEKIVKQ